jgi:hypothetical protein
MTQILGDNNMLDMHTNNIWNQGERRNIRSTVCEEIDGAWRGKSLRGVPNHHQRNVRMDKLNHPTTTTRMYNQRDGLCDDVILLPLCHSTTFLYFWQQSLTKESYPLLAPSQTLALP